MSKVTLLDLGNCQKEQSHDFGEPTPNHAVVADGLKVGGRA